MKPVQVVESQWVRGIAAFIRERRRALALSQDELAGRLRISRNTISNWERAVHAPSLPDAPLIGRALELTPEELEAFERLIRTGEITPALLALGSFRTQVSERTPRYGEPSIGPRVPPKAYQLIFEHCTSLEAAGVPEHVVEEARRLMSGETFNTLNKGVSDSRSEGDWAKDVEAAWDFIRDRLKAKGFRL